MSTIARNGEIERLLFDNGAALVGFAELGELGPEGLPRAVSIAAAIDASILQGIKKGPTAEYFDEYNRLNRLLDKLALICQEFLKGMGYNAVAQTTTIAHQSDDLATPLPHKTVATRAGLGWIGKCALLVTKQLGSGIRLTSVLTDAPFICGEPVVESNCGNCIECLKHCPAGAVRGPNWSPGIDRGDIFDAYACRETARRLCKESFGEEATICGKCIVVCPYTKKHLKRV